MKDVAGHPRLVQQPDGVSGDQRRLLRRLGDHRVARRQRRGDLAAEYGEGEVPRADAGEDAAAGKPEPVVLSGRALQLHRPREIGAGAGGVIAAEIHRLADLGQRICEGLAGLAHQERDQRRPVVLEQIPRFVEDGGARFRRRPVPFGRRRARLRQRRADIACARIDHGSDGAPAVGGVKHRTRLRLAHGVGAADHGRRPPALLQSFLHVPGERLQRRGIGEIDAGGISPLGPEKIARQRNHGVGLDRQPLGRRHRIGDDVFDRRGVIDDAVDEGGVGAVLEQPADEVGQQILVGADGSVDAAAISFRPGTGQLLVKRLAHAVQTLELKLAVLAGELDDRRRGVGVVGGELGEKRAGLGEKLARAGDERDIGRDLAGEHRVSPKALLLGALDLGVPVGALDQAHHDPAPVRARQLPEPVDDRAGAFLIGLHGEAQAVPTGERRRRRDPFEDLERWLEPVGLLGIHRQADTGVPGRLTEDQQLLRQLHHYPAPLGELVSRMKGRKLDRDRRRRHRIGPGRARADGRDRASVGVEVAPGVVRRQRRLAQHVVGVGVPRLLGRRRPVERVLDGASHDVLAAEDTYGAVDRLADHRLARARDEAAQEAEDVALLGAIEPDDAPGQDQPPGRGVDQQ